MPACMFSINPVTKALWELLHFRSGAGSRGSSGGSTPGRKGHGRHRHSPRDKVRQWRRNSFNSFLQMEDEGRELTKDSFFSHVVSTNKSRVTKLIPNLLQLAPANWSL